MKNNRVPKTAEGVGDLCKIPGVVNRGEGGKGGSEKFEHKICKGEEERMEDITLLHVMSITAS